MEEKDTFQINIGRATINKDIMRLNSLLRSTGDHKNTLKWDCWVLKILLEQVAFLGLTNLIMWCLFTANVLCPLSCHSWAKDATAVPQRHQRTFLFPSLNSVIPGFHNTLKTSWTISPKMTRHTEGKCQRSEPQLLKGILWGVALPH